MKVQLQKQCSGYYTSALSSKQHYCCNHKCILLIATHKHTTEITQQASNMSGLSVFCKCTTGQPFIAQPRPLYYCMCSSLTAAQCTLLFHTLFQCCIQCIASFFIYLIFSESFSRFGTSGFPSCSLLLHLLNPHFFLTHSIGMVWALIGLCLQRKGFEAKRSYNENAN